MAKISTISSTQLIALQKRIGSIAKDVDTLEQAAQNYMKILFEELKESIVLIRLFATVQFSHLPSFNQKFVSELAHLKNIDDELDSETLVLSLFGTQGRESAWNDRTKSAAHIGIPLVSKAFVESIPMLCRLLQQLGIGLDWVDSNDKTYLVRTVGSISGVFRVADAGKDKDSQGRMIIPAQDFVRKYGVKTVFGFGGGYLGSPTFFTTIIFTNEVIPESTVQHFMVQANKFKTATMKMVDAGRLFCEHDLAKHEHPAHC